MKKRFLFRKSTYLWLVVIILTSFISYGFIGAEKKSRANNRQNQTRQFLLNDKDLANKIISYQTEDVILDIDLDLWETVSGNQIIKSDSGIFIPIGTSCNINFTLRASGDYQIIAEYTSNEKYLFENTVNVKVNNDDFICAMPFFWADDIENLRTDHYGNEIVPKQNQLDVPAVTYLEDYENFNRTPIVFHLEKGENNILFQPQKQDLILLSLRIIKPVKDITYREYQQNYNDISEAQELVIIEGEDYRAKSDSFIRGRNIWNTNVVPGDPYIKLINATDDKSNKTIGQKIIYEVNIPKDGCYYLTFKYSQPMKIGGAVYRTIEVDGKVPYEEARDVGFTHTGIDKYQNYTLGGESPRGIYLTAGLHTIALKTTAAPINDIYYELLDIVNEINDTGILLKKIKGSNSDDTAKIDANRTWDIFQYMPDVLDKLNGWQLRLNTVYDELKELSGKNPSYASDLMLAHENLKRLASEPREIPNRMNLLSDDSSSAAQLISLTLSKILEQNLSIDRFYLHPKEEKLPSPKEGILDKLLKDIKQFFHSFTPKMNESSDIKSKDNSLSIWINKPSQYVEALRELTAQEFTMRTGISVEYSIMPDEKKITLANSTGSNPDIALGLTYFRPAEFAMRKIAKNLLEYEDFLDWYEKEYNLESLAPMAYEDGIYAASETQDFYVLFYRTDILEMLGLDVPDTWDDVKEMMPALHRNAMNFNHPLANNVGYKSFEATGSFIFQNDGNYYTGDGLYSNFNETNTKKGLREMTDLFLVYGLAQNVPNFFNAFRSGTIPIGISNFSTYLQLQVAAPELTGRWDIAPVPGTRQEDGSISRYYSADATSALIFSNTKKPDEAYLFLKWWLSGDTQISYANDLQMKYGPDYIWNTANHVALEQMSYPKKHMDVILEQWAWQKEALRHPASYILEREISNAWIDIVTHGESFQPRLDEAALASNREMKRKLTEFGYYDDEGNVVKEYNVHLIDELTARYKKVRGDGNE